MVFKNNIPQPTDNLSVSQGDLLGNNQQLDTSFGFNHYAFSDLTTDNGKHKFISMPPQVASPATAVGELALVAKTVVADGVCLFLTRDNNTAFDVQLTTDKIARPLGNTNGYTFLPGGASGGIIIQWGTAAINAGGASTVINFPVAFTASAFNVQITPDNNNVSNSPSANMVFIKQSAITSTNFTVVNSSASGVVDKIYWMAIGI